MNSENFIARILLISFRGKSEKFVFLSFQNCFMASVFRLYYKVILCSFYRFDIFKSTNSDILNRE
jgi:hypothetical protein